MTLDDARLDLLGIGQGSLDCVSTVRRMPGAGEKEEALDFALLPGGQIATAVLAASRLGLRVGLITSVGDDNAGQRTLAPLADAGVDLSGVRRIAGAPSQRALIQIDAHSGERSVVWHRDPRLSLAPSDVPAARIENARALLLDAGDPGLATEAARIARRAGIPVVLDADTWNPMLSDLLRSVDYPIVSAGFARSFAQNGSIRGALHQLLEWGATLAVATLGPAGCLARNHDREFASPGFAIEARDSTGAGDVFHAAFTWGLLEGLDVTSQLHFANAAAALSCRGFGAQGALPTREEVEAWRSSESPGPWRDPDSGSG